MSEWKWTLMFAADPNRWIAVTAPPRRTLYPDAVTPLGPLVEDGAAAWHPIIRGELLLGASGRLSARRFALLDEIFTALPKLVDRSTDEVCSFIAEHALTGSRIGIADAHIALAALESRCSLWTLETALLRVARRLRLPTFA